MHLRFWVNIAKIIYKQYFFQPGVNLVIKYIIMRDLQTIFKKLVKLGKIFSAKHKVNNIMIVQLMKCLFKKWSNRSIFLYGFESWVVKIAWFKELYAVRVIVKTSSISLTYKFSSWFKMASNARHTLHDFSSDFQSPTVLWKSQTNAWNRRQISFVRVTIM